MFDQDLNITGTSRASEIVFPRRESRASTPQTHLESAAESASTSEQKKCQIPGGPPGDHVESCHLFMNFEIPNEQDNKDNVEHGTSSIGVLNSEAPPGKGSSAVRILETVFHRFSHSENECGCARPRFSCRKGRKSMPTSGTRTRMY